MARVTPVYKKGAKHDPGNYRPFSLTCLACKVMEHVVLSHFNKHPAANDIISYLQHGFRAGFSCETQLILAVQDWASILNNHGQVDVLMLDFKKAFDKVSHAKLRQKLQFYGISGKTLSWLCAFLSNRSQFIVGDGAYSSAVPVTSGVPQGTVLGPTLFLLFINDIADSLDSQMRLFADDAIVYRQVSR